MGEKKMIRKESKTPSQKKNVAAVAPAAKSISSWSYDYPPPISCPSISRAGGVTKSWILLSHRIRKNISRSGGVTKSWISSCCTHQQPRQTWPQLVETNLIQWKTHLCFHKFLYTSPWRMRGCRIAEPYYSGDNRLMEFTNVIRFQKKFYAISRQGSLAVIEVIKGGGSRNFEITGLGRNRVVPRCQVSKHFREYLLEYEGEIYLVFLLSRESINVVDDVEVLRLDRSRLVWEKVDRLVGDAMFFLEGNGGVGISGSLLGCSNGSNCVYFTHDRADGTWFVYDMKTCCISTTFGPEIDPVSRSVSRIRISLRYL